MLKEIRDAAYTAATELCQRAHIKQGDRIVIGCSSSEIMGHSVGTGSSPETAEAVYEGIAQALREHGAFLVAQCCEHLNRALIMEREALRGEDIVNVVPQPKAGGSFATAAYRHFEHPVAVERIRADAGLDIGNTLIGMHLKEVAVPLRLSVTQIGSAWITAARTRPRFIGGVRAVYDEQLL